MRLKDPRAIDGIRRDEEKALRIKGYLSEFVMSLAAAPADCRRDIYVLARAVESPVLAAALALSQELAAVRAPLFAIIGAPGPDEEELDLLRAKAAAPFDLTVRIARHPRLADAHEQLVLGDSATWYGDSLRRDPWKRDAFESFTARDSAKARTARLAFYRLWQVAEPLDLGHGARSDVSAPAARPAVTGGAPIERQ